jgi:hypothetical protein
MPTTGWLRQSNGSSQVIDLTDIGYIESALIRFKGVRKLTTVYEYNYGTSTIPPVPAGYEFDSWSASCSALCTNNTGSIISVRLTIHITDDYGGFSHTSGPHTEIAPGESAWLYIDYDSTNSNYLGRSVSMSCNAGTLSNKSTSTTTRGRSTGYVQTRNPRATVNGVQVQGPSSLGNGVITDWYPLNLIAGQSNTITYAISGSGQVDVEIVYNAASFKAFVYVNGVWQPVREAYAHVSGVWQPVKKIYAQQNGTWQLSK